MLQWCYQNAFMVAGVTAAAAMLLCHFVLNLPVWIGVPAGLLLGAGLYIFGRGGMDERIRRQSSGLTMLDAEVRADASRDLVQRIRAAAADTPDKEASRLLRSLADLADRVLDNFKDDPGDLRKSSRFILYLEKLLPMAERYARLAATPEGRELLRERGEDKAFLDALSKAEEAFAQGYKNYLENDVVELGRLGRVMTRMMDVAEIGK